MTFTLILWATMIVFLLANYAVGFRFKLRTIAGVGMLLVALSIVTIMLLLVYAQADASVYSRLWVNPS